MAKIPEAQNRLFKNVFVCKKCKSKIRAEPRKLSSGKLNVENVNQRHLGR